MKQMTTTATQHIEMPCQNNYKDDSLDISVKISLGSLQIIKQSLNLDNDNNISGINAKKTRDLQEVLHRRNNTPQGPFNKKNIHSLKTGGALGSPKSIGKLPWQKFHYLEEDKVSHNKVINQLNQKINESKSLPRLQSRQSNNSKSRKNINSNSQNTSEQSGLVRVLSKNFN